MSSRSRIMPLRRLVYKLGFRPKPGSIFFSPSLSYIYAYRAELKRRGGSLLGPRP